MDNSLSLEDDFYKKKPINDITYMIKLYSTIVIRLIISDIAIYLSIYRVFLGNSCH